MAAKKQPEQIEEHETPEVTVESKQTPPVETQEPPLVTMPQPENQSSANLPAPRKERILIVPKWSQGLPPAIPDYAIALQDPAELRQVIQDNLGAQMLRIFDLQKITVPTGGARMWAIESVRGFESKEYIEGVVVTWIQPRAFWKIPYDQGGGGAIPDCKSDDGFRGVGDPGGECLACPMSQFGSAKTVHEKQGDGQACQQSRLLFVMEKDSNLPCIIKAPATSLKNLQKFFVGLAAKGIAYHHCVMRFRLEPEKNGQGQPVARIIPTLQAALNADEIQRVGLFMQTFRPLVQQVASDFETYTEN